MNKFIFLSFLYILLFTNTTQAEEFSDPIVLVVELEKDKLLYQINSKAFRGDTLLKLSTLHQTNNNLHVIINDKVSLEQFILINNLVYTAGYSDPKFFISDHKKESMLEIKLYKEYIYSEGQKLTKVHQGK